MQSRSKRFAEFFQTIEPLLDDIEARGVAKPDRSVVPEGDSRDDGYVRLTQQSIGKVLRLEPIAAHVEENVEGAHGADSSQPGNVAESIEHVLAANIELVAHVGDALLIAFQSSQSALLRK